MPNVIDREEQLASAQSRSQFFWLLADGVLNGAHAESLSLLGALDSETGVPSALKSNWQNLVDATRNLDEDARNRLAVEHTRLFAGLREGESLPPPFESAWLPAAEPGLTTLAVTRAYAEAGFADIDPEAGPQDHLGVELKFVAMLALREAEAWQAGDSAGAATRARQQRAFLDDHLLEWAPRWADGLAQQTEEPLFLALAGLLWDVLTQERC